MQRRHRRTHLRLWLALALLLPTVLAFAFQLNRAQTTTAAPVQLAPPGNEVAR